MGHQVALFVTGLVPDAHAIDSPSRADRAHRLAGSGDEPVHSVLPQIVEWKPEYFFIRAQAVDAVALISPSSGVEWQTVSLPASPRRREFLATRSRACPRDRCEMSGILSVLGIADGHRSDDGCAPHSARPSRKSRRGVSLSSARGTRPIARPPASTQRACRKGNRADMLTRGSPLQATTSDSLPQASISRSSRHPP